MEEIVFNASLPPSQSAVKIGGDGARIQLDIPQSDVEAAATLGVEGQYKHLIVTIREAEG